MAFDKKPMTGVLFQTREKDRRPGAPESTGNFLFSCSCGRCTEVQLSAWNKIAKTSGQPYQRLEERKGQSKPDTGDPSRPGPGAKAPEREYTRPEPPGPVGEMPEAGDDLTF